MKKLKQTWLVVGVLGLTLVIACSVQTRLPKNEPQQPGFVNGQIVAQIQDKNQASELSNQYDVRLVDKEMNIYLLKSKGNISVSDEVTRIENLPGVTFAQPNFLLHLKREAPRDPLWLEQWALKNYGQDAPNGVEGREGYDIGALEAWKTSQGSRDVVVAIIDTGIDYTHPDLKENIWVNTAELSGTPGVDDDGNGYADDVYGWDFESGTRETSYHGQLGDPDPLDDNGHGTHVAGTIGAASNNGVGVTGVNWQVRMMALKFLSAGGSGTSLDAYRAVRYAAANGADVMNNSWGGGPAEPLLLTAIKEAEKKGVLFVAAAGNDTSDNDATPSYPANYDVASIVSVAATNNRDELADFSNYGVEKVHIAAPGVAITSTFPVALTGDAAPYRSFSGTSMATPHVVGAAALVLAANPQFKKKPLELKQRLLNTADWRPQLAGRVSSGGRLNLAAAVSGRITNRPDLTTGWVEEAYSVSTPRHPTEKIDQVWTIQKKNVKAIQVHVNSAVVDQGFDVATLYDSFYRLVGYVPSAVADYWLPVVIGDTVHLKFSNAIVFINKSRIEKVADPATLPKFSICYKENSNETLYTCEIHDAGQSFPNFNSEGVQVDRIRYIP